MIQGDCERYRIIRRNYATFDMSYMRNLYGSRDDENSYIENHPSNYVEHISLISLVMITAAQIKLFLIFVQIENLMHNQLLTLVFMIQLVIAVISYGFMVAKILQSTHKHLHKHDLLIMCSIFFIFASTLTIVSVC